MSSENNANTIQCMECKTLCTPTGTTGSRDVVAFMCRNCNTYQVGCLACRRDGKVMRSYEEASTEQISHFRRNFKHRHTPSCGQSIVDENLQAGDDHTGEEVGHGNDGDQHGDVTNGQVNIDSPTANDDEPTTSGEPSWDNDDGDETHNDGEPTTSGEPTNEDDEPHSGGSTLDSDDGDNNDETDSIHEWERAADRALWAQATFGDASRAYFYENHLSSRETQKGVSCQGGIRCLAYRSIYGKGRNAKKVMACTPFYTWVILQMLNLLVDMSPDHKTRLVGLLAGVFALMTVVVGNVQSMPLYPTDKQSLESMLIGKESSMWNNLPCEEVWVFDDFHVTISIDSVIDHIMAHGIPLSFMQDENGNVNTEGINGSPAAQNLLQRLRDIVKAEGKDPTKTAFGYLILWSDGFVTSWVKQKDNKCWCMTVTVAPPEGNDRSIFHTHCIALGKGGDHHSLIVDKLDELDEIRKGKMRYDGIQKKWIHTSFDIIVYMADRPERSEIIRALGHTGLTSKRFRYAAYASASDLSPCDDCLAKMVRNVVQNSQILNVDECASRSKCCNWNYKDGNSWKKVSPRPEKYPEKVSEDSQATIGIPDGRDVEPGLTKYIKPHKQDFEWMKAGAELALKEVSEGNWGLGQAGEYLRSFAICAEVADEIKAEGKRRNERRKEIEREDRRRGVKRKADEMYDTQSDSVLPAIWSKGYDLSTFIECPMHLLFLGITKALAACFSSLMTSHKHLSSFQEDINAHLEDIASFRLDYCMLKPLPDTLWVSENYIGLARVLPWVYGNYTLNFRPGENSNVSIPGVWLKQARAMERLMNAYNVMVSVLMSRDEVDIDLLEQRIKVFLSTCNQLGIDINMTFIDGKGNFYSLLNLPEQIAEFGPLRDWWDGDFEFSIQAIRPDLKRVRRSMSQYFKHKLVFARRKRSLAIINEQFGVEDKDNIFLDMMNPDEEVEKNKAGFYSSFYRFDTVEDIRARVSEGLVLCGFYNSNSPGQVFVSFGNGRKEIDVLILTLAAGYPEDYSKHCGLNYSALLICDKPVQFDKEEFLKFCDGFCLILPLLKRQRDDAFQYTIVTDSWTTLQNDGTLSPPSLCIKELFKDEWGKNSWADGMRVPRTRSRFGRRYF